VLCTLMLRLRTKSNTEVVNELCMWLLLEQVFVEYLFALFRPLHNSLHFEETLQPVDLEHAFSNQDTELEEGPPFDTRIRAFCCVAMSAFANDDICLFVLDLSQSFRHLLDWTCSA
jgi:hypothetical protein